MRLRRKQMAKPWLKRFMHGSRQAAVMTLIGEPEAVAKVAETWQRDGKVSRLERQGDKTTIYFARSFKIGIDGWPDVFAQFHDEARAHIESQKKRR